MLLLNDAKIGDLVHVNIELSKDRLTKEIFDTINISPVGRITEFRITDGKGIGVVLQLSNGKEQWFFEDEIDLLDEYGNIIEKINDTKKDKSLINEILNGVKYENKNKVSELINPINFFFWLIVSFKDIF